MWHKVYMLRVKKTGGLRSIIVRAYNELTSIQQANTVVD